MKLTVKLNDLRYVVNIASIVSPTRTTLPALNAVLLAYHDCELVARTSDMVNTAIARCGAIGEQSGAFGVSTARLSDYLACCVAEEVEIDTAERAIFQCGTETTTLAITPADQFNEVVDVEGQSFTASAKDLHEGIARVIHAAHDDDTGSASLASVVFDFADDLSLVSFCGPQFACSRIPVSAAQGRFIVPRKFIHYALKMLDGHEGDSTVTFSESAVKMEGESWSLIGSLMNGQFPDWRQIEKWIGMPKVTIPREAFLRALKGCVPFGEAGFTRALFSGIGDSLYIRVSGQNERMSEVPMKGTEFSFASDAKRLLALISVLKNDDVTLQYDGQAGHGIVVQEQNFIGGVMPLRK